PRVGAQPLRPRGGGAAPALRGGGQERAVRPLRALRPRRPRRRAAAELRGSGPGDGDPGDAGHQPPRVGAAGVPAPGPGDPRGGHGQRGGVPRRGAPTAGHRPAMRWLSDAAVDHLREVADRPDLAQTPYELQEPIARGGMGTVYRARDRRLDRDVAIKVMNAPAPAPAELERMRNEARILARLEHPGILPVHDLGALPDGRLFYVMKLVRGQRLDEAIAEQPLHARLRTFGRICEAVAFAHAQGVVHRDLKPENVMVGPFGEVLVLDWGVAKILRES